MLLSIASVSCSAVSPTTTTAGSASRAARAAAVINCSSGMGTGWTTSPARAIRWEITSRATRIRPGTTSTTWVQLGGTMKPTSSDSPGSRPVANAYVSSP